MEEAKKALSSADAELKIRKAEYEQTLKKVTLEREELDRQKAESDGRLEAHIKQFNSWLDSFQD